VSPEPGGAPTTRAPIPVVAAVIHREGRYLLGRRPLAKRHGGLWEFPGGKVDEGESLMDAARRELREELGVRTASIGACLFAMADEGSAFMIEFHEVDIDGTPVAREHDVIGWFTPDELRSMALAPVDAQFVARLTARAS